jgi:hemolysin activation/secretion protein
MGYVQRAGLGFLLASLLSSTAIAQVRPTTIPSPAQPGQVEQHIQNGETRPEVGGQPLITMPKETTKKNYDSSVTFTLKDIEFENLTAFTKADLLPDYKEYLGKKISLNTLNEIAEKVTVQYRNAGYILSRAVVPPQHIGDGIAKIRIVEGYINKVSFQGKDTNSGLLGRYASKISSAKPLDAQTLERYLLLINDLPGVSAHAVLVPAAGTPGASDVVVTIDDKKIDGSVTFDNRGSRYIGPVQAGLTANVNNLFGNYDRTQFHGVQTAEYNELHYGQISHDEQLDSEGTKLTLSAAYTHTHPAFNEAFLNLDGEDKLFTAMVNHPFIRTRQTNLYGNVEFDIHDTQVESGLFQSDFYKDHLRVARAGGAFDFVDGLAAVNKFDGQVSHGFSWEADSFPESTSNSNASPTFTKFAGTASRLQPISGPFDLYVAASGQWSADSLYIGEQFGIGGANFGSAYDPSEITGDSGADVRAELRYNRIGDFSLIPSYQFYGFYDLGKVWNKTDSLGTPSDASLADAGVGLRFNASSPLTGSLELAAPLTRVVAADGTSGSSEGYRPRIFFSLAYRY